MPLKTLLIFKGGPGSGNHGHSGRVGEVGGSGHGGVAGARTPAPPASERSMRAKTAHVMVDKEIQRYAEEHNEGRFAKAVGGVAFPNSEPIDIAIPGPNGIVAHGVELKTVVNNGNSKLTMKREAQERKAAWERKNKATIHTVVLDDTKVFNAKGPGKHDESKRVYYYRRGFGSYRLSNMERVTSIDDVKRLINTPTRSLPPNAKR